MTQRAKIIIAVVAGIAVLFIAALVLAPRRVDRYSPPAPSATIGVPSAAPPRALPAATPVTKEPRTQATLEALAITFAERFGSYSSERQPDYLKLLIPMMTARFGATVKIAVPATPGFYGITTKALNSQIIALNPAENEAQVVVQTQRRETRGGVASAPAYQKLTLTLVKAETGWQVDRADWQ